MLLTHELLHVDDCQLLIDLSSTLLHESVVVPVDDWYLRTIPSSMHKADEFLMLATFCNTEKLESYGLAWGFPSRLETINRFVLHRNSGIWQVSQQLPKQRIHRFNRRGHIPPKATGEDVLAILYTQQQYYFYVNDLKHPVCQVSGSDLPVMGHQLGSYTRDYPEVSMNRFKMWTLKTSARNSLSIQNLLEMFPIERMV